MTVTVELWQVLTLLGGLLGGMAALGRFILIQVEKRLDQKFETMEQSRAAASQQWSASFSAIDSMVRANEQRLTQLLIDLPLQYQRREDAIRQDVSIIHRLDALAGKVDSALRPGACPLHSDSTATPRAV